MELGHIEVNRISSEEWMMGRYCALCGESFPTYPSDYEVICPECKEIWKKIKTRLKNEN